MRTTGWDPIGQGRVCQARELALSHSAWASLGGFWEGHEVAGFRRPCHLTDISNALGQRTLWGGDLGRRGPQGPRGACRSGTQDAS